MVYRQFGGHKNRKNKSLKIEFNFLIVYFGLFWVFIHVRLTIQRIRIFALLDKKLFICLMQNVRSFSYLMLRVCSTHTGRATKHTCQDRD